MLKSRFDARRRHAGHSLLEALVAMLVLGLGIAGLAWAQARLVIEGRASNGRSIAVSLVNDLADRMAFNTATAASGGYALAWGDTPAPHDCRSAACTGALLAQSDLATWRGVLAASLPAGDASVFQSPADPRQIGIAISWSLGAHAPADPGTYATTVASHGVDCPVQRLCHVAYVQP